MEICPTTAPVSTAAVWLPGVALRRAFRCSAAPVTQRGFTLIELLIVISIAAILATIAVPSFRDMLRTTRQNSALGLMVNDLNLARGEAIKRNGSVIVCARNPAGDDCAVTGAWQGGWVVCLEALIANTCLDTTGAVPPNPNPFAVRPPLDDTMTLTSSSIDPIRFRANSTATAGTLALSGTWSGAPSRTVVVAGTGNISKQ
jgi:type IV fimbrial biogenesis protein FimT